MLSLLKHELWSRWGAVLGWGIGLALFGIMYVAIYPEFNEKMDLAAMSDISFYQAFGFDMASFEGFIASSVVQFIPLILAIYVIMTSTATLAGEDDGGTLELIVTMPLNRWQITTMKATAMAIVAFLILVIAGAGSAIALNGIRESIEVDVTGSQLFVAILSGWPITLAFLMIGLFCGACLPNRRTASMAATMIFLISYFGEPVAGFVESLDVMKPFSLFYYFDSTAGVFSEGVQAGDVWVLLGVATFFFALAVIAFERRDITVGQWPWERAKARRATK